MSDLAQILNGAVLTRPDAVIFDWDNTLIDSWTVLQAALNATFRDYDLPEWSLAETRERVAHSMRDSFPLLFGDEWEQAGKVFYGHFEALHLDALTPLPGCEAALGELHEAGVYLGVVSNKTGSLLRREAEVLGWDRYFGRIVGSMDAANDKPAADPVHLVLSDSGTQAGASVWFAGDALVDMECAHNSGCIAALVRAEGPEADAFADAPPHIHAKTAQNLSNLAKNL